MSAEPPSNGSLAGCLSATTAPSVEMREVHKHLGGRPVLRGVNLQVRPGRTLAIVGPNGAGKTTLLRIVATLARPSAGSVRVCGLDALAEPIAARRHIGVVAAATFLYDELTGAENLRYYARLYGVAAAEPRIRALAGLVGLREHLDERVGAYSRGMAQRLSIARALLHRPDVLLLDEPDTGLDPATVSALPRLLRGDGAQERAIILTGHDLHLMLDLADDIAVLARGRFSLAAPSCTLTPTQLRHAYDQASL